MFRAPQNISEPHKEIRFTRSGQGRAFAVAAGACLGAAVVLALFALRPDPPVAWWWILPPLAAGILLALIARHCTAHAYLIFTPLGVEIFPLWKPRDNLHVVFWSEIVHAEVNDACDLLTLHYNDERTAGVVVSLRPVHPRKRSLCARAVEGVMEKRAEASGEPSEAGAAETHKPISK